MRHRDVPTPAMCATWFIDCFNMRHQVRYQGVRIGGIFPDMEVMNAGTSICDSPGQV